jgi:hypothetical protein
MAYIVSKLDVWSGEIADQVGGLAAKLGPLAKAKVDLSFVIARRQPHMPGKGIMFLAGISGAKGSKAAADAGLGKTTELAALRVEGANKPGDCHRLVSQLADAGLNLRGLSASVCGKKYVLILAFDSEADAAKAAQVIRAMNKGK